MSRPPPPERRRLADAAHHTPDPLAPLVVFAHGSGASSSHPWMAAWSARLSSQLRAPVHTFDFGHVSADGGVRRPPARMPQLVGELRGAVAEARRARPAAARNGVLLVGKSLGARVALAAVREVGDVVGVVGLGYPVSGRDEGRRRLVRRAVVPVLLVQGDRDRVADIGEIRELAKDEGCGESLEVLEVPAGDHSLLVTKKWLRDSGMTQDDVDEDISSGLCRWLGRVMDRRRARETGEDEN